MPRVSVGIPVRNCERFIGRSIESILGQSYSDLELIISDNASTDGTEDICRQYARIDSRVRYSRLPENIGGPANFRRVFALGTSEFHKWTTADDYWDVSFVEKAVRVLDERPGFVLCYSMTSLIDAAGVPVGEYDDNLLVNQDSPAARFRYVISNLGLCHADLGVIRRSAMQKTRLMTSERACDAHFLAEISLYGKFWVLPERLFFRRIHDQSSSWERASESRQREYYDPRHLDQIGMHAWRKYSRLLGAVVRSPLPLSDKASLTGSIARWMVWDREALSRDFLRLLSRSSRPLPHS